MNPFESADSFEKFKLANNLTEEHIRGLQIFFKKEYSVSTEIVILLSILYGIISMVAVVGNVLVMFVVMARRNMQTVTNIIIANLAFSDVILGMFTIPFQFQTIILGRWTVAEFMCKVAPFVKNLSVHVSIFCLTLIAVDRYIAVMHPLKAGFHKMVAALIISIIWVIGIIISLPEALYHRISIYFSISELKERTSCTKNWPSDLFNMWYSVVKLSTQYVVPLVVISVSYIRIVRKIWGDDRPGEKMFSRKDTRSRNKSKVVRMLIIVVALFAICWLPVQIYNILVPFLKTTINGYKHIDIIWLCSNWLAMSNACYNPFIYGLLNEKFKKEFKILFRICICCKDSGNVYNRIQRQRFNNTELTTQKTSLKSTQSNSSNRRQSDSSNRRQCGCSNDEKVIAAIDNKVTSATDNKVTAATDEKVIAVTEANVVLVKRKLNK